MPSADLLREAGRQLTICNACRYCEGYCAVFPAMELRRSFAEGDLIYLANLCHECRACYYACQYAPPHEFAVNIPKTLAELRLDTYEDYSWPRPLAALMRRNGLAGALVTASGLVIVLLLALFVTDSSTPASTPLGEGAFYAVIPYVAMVAPAGAMMLFAAAVFGVGFLRFWRDMGGSLKELVDLPALVTAARDGVGLHYMKGGGDGCSYPDERFSHARRRFHHLVFYGFLLNLASTTVAAIYHHWLDEVGPYAYSSVPVLLGTVGGVGLIIGTGGLLYLKLRSDEKPAEAAAQGMDLAFITLLFLTSLTGLLLLGLRGTTAMGTLLAIHLGVVAAFFLTLPYGKFAHVVYRSAALLRYAIEQRVTDR